MTGLLSNGTAGNGRHNGRVVDENAPLLSRSSPRKGRVGLRARMGAEVSCSWADAVLLACYLVTGLLDSCSIQVWGSFVSMQTGNTVYVGLGLASLVSTTTSPRLFKSAVSISSFCVGSFLFARFHRFFSPRRRWVLCASFAAQALLTIAAALITTTYPPTGNEDPFAWNVLVPIALIAFQSCGQAVASRALRQNAFISVVLTSIYCDLFSDRDLFALHNVGRNRRVVAPLLLVLGAVLGGLFANSSVGIAGALWLAAGLKFCMVVTWFFWPAEEDSEWEE
ncbi:hypothetical protein BGZ61DRAFT_473383 [Ilyonectria robusta]|uniref:uncharacterized protein n=1 Tax=Ilyonectria robusta TaxID=1079257 RepID=UPI001E8E0991|nr:uncharacterized protein BGZ61DRAFT_473383 [Ilyonectria robusta]KAH8734673.1 hypothetical protein BGZ61DRAFT_473383 [Ilyonectria robusta]